MSLSIALDINIIDKCIINHITSYQSIKCLIPPLLGVVMTTAECHWSKQPYVLIREAGNKWPPFSKQHFHMHFLNWNVYISSTISLKCVPKGAINDIPALVRIMASRRQSDKPLSEPMVASLLTNLCVTRPQWVKWMLFWLLLYLYGISSKYASLCNEETLEPFPNKSITQTQSKYVLHETVWWKQGNQLNNVRIKIRTA